MIERCPTCKQTIPQSPPVRICADCQHPIARHDKFTYRTITIDAGQAQVLVHRHCDNPTSYRGNG